MTIYRKIFGLRNSTLSNIKPYKVGLYKLEALVFIAFQVLVFLPALMNPIPWSDDWVYINFANDSSRNIFHDAVASGRPVLGILDQFAYQSNFILNNLVILQIFSISGLFFLQLAIFSKLKTNGLPNPIALLVPLTLILIPGIQGYVYFLSCSPYSWACLFGFLSFNLINSRHPSRVIFGCTLFVTSFLIYPAGAMFYLVSYFIDHLQNFRSGNTFRSDVRHLFFALTKLAACSVGSILIAMLVRTHSGVSQSSRIELVSSFEDFVEKVFWIISRLFVSEFRVFTVASPSPRRAALEATIVLILFVLFILKPMKNLTIQRTLSFGLLLLIPVLGALPNLLILENQFEFRTLTSAYAMSLILWVYSIHELIKLLLHGGRSNNSRMIGKADKRILIVFLPLVLFTAHHTQQDSRNLWIEPSIIRDEVTLATLRGLDSENNESICMLIPKQLYEPLNRLGIYSLQSDLVSSWVPEPYMNYQMQRLLMNSERQIIVSRNRYECGPLDVVIDYSILGKGRS